MDRLSRLYALHQEMLKRGGTPFHLPNWPLPRTLSGLSSPDKPHRPEQAAESRREASTHEEPVVGLAVAAIPADISLADRALPPK